VSTPMMAAMCEDANGGPRWRRRYLTLMVIFSETTGGLNG
jgi:hypothetical protein